MPRTPILLMSDAPTAGTGLARITRDLATRIHETLPEFRVATLGYGGQYRRSLGFLQYEMDMKDWVVYNLPDVWKDFAGEEKGIVLTIWDASRLLWFARPESCTDRKLQKFLMSNPFEKWGYWPVDAVGPHGKLTACLKHTLEAYDRNLAYSKWAQGILKNTGITADWLPHGIDTSVFYPRNRHAARHGFGERIKARTAKDKWLSIPDDALMVGIVGTNQLRKDWGLGVQTVAELAKERNVMLWCHIDRPEHNWSIPALLNDFGIAEKTVESTVPFSDEQMAWNYSACDVTLGIGLGEGFGFAAAESLACGTPVVAPDYGGGEFIPKEMLVCPEMYRLEGPYNCVRPVMDPPKFARKVNEVEDQLFMFPQYIAWDNLWPKWADWLQAGLK